MGKSFMCTLIQSFHFQPFFFSPGIYFLKDTLCPLSCRLFHNLILLNAMLALGASLVAHMVKNLPAMQETWVRSLSWEDPEKGIATHSSILAWRISWTEEPGGLHTGHGVAN